MLNKFTCLNGCTRTNYRLDSCQNIVNFKNVLRHSLCLTSVPKHSLFGDTFFNVKLHKNFSFF